MTINEYKTNDFMVGYTIPNITISTLLTTKHKKQVMLSTINTEDTGVKCLLRSDLKVLEISDADFFTALYEIGKVDGAVVVTNLTPLGDTLSKGYDVVKLIADDSGGNILVLDIQKSLHDVTTNLLPIKDLDGVERILKNTVLHDGTARETLEFGTIELEHVFGLSAIDTFSYFKSKYVDVCDIKMYLTEPVLRFKKKDKQ